MVFVGQTLIHSAMAAQTVPVTVFVCIACQFLPGLPMLFSFLAVSSCFLADVVNLAILASVCSQVN